MLRRDLLSHRERRYFKGVPQSVYACADAQPPLQPVLRLELVPRLVERAEHGAADHALLGGRVLGDLHAGQHNTP